MAGVAGDSYAGKDTTVSLELKKLAAAGAVQLGAVLADDVLPTVWRSAAE
ncbi:hypothetical protein LWP59_36055 [Amycolatopsis acidiphila]|nr:hypothetical protein [Amycolatopsis acidiphila]UIJ59398.1 hypothetical protein LWP59_36055 [Amycolatopsis acidiphila]